MLSRSALSILVGVLMAVTVVAAAWVISGSPGRVPKRGVHLALASSAEPVFVQVQPGDSAASIGRRLAQARVIDSARSFQLLAAATGDAGRLESGEYEFNPGTSVLDAIDRIHNGLVSTRVVTVPEGLRMEQIADLLDKRGIVSAADFLSAAKALLPLNNSPEAALIASRPAGASLEGYLYPATYSFPHNLTPQDIVQMMVKALADRLTPDLVDQARQEGLTVYQVLIFASIVEREAVLPEERPVIASVYLNRYHQDMPLQADPTVQYAVTQQQGDVSQYGYWKSDLTRQDLQSASEYNTYTKKGLPPGPICNPGIDSILAVLHPASTDYLFFVARPDGSHAFSKTFEEHVRNVQRYQGNASN